MAIKRVLFPRPALRNSGCAKSAYALGCEKGTADERPEEKLCTKSLTPSSTVVPGLNPLVRMVLPLVLFVVTVSADVVEEDVAVNSETCGFRRSHPYRPISCASNPGTSEPPEYWPVPSASERAVSSTRLVVYDEETVAAGGSTLAGASPGDAKLSSGTAVPPTPGGASMMV